MYFNDIDPPFSTGAKKDSHRNKDNFHLAASAKLFPAARAYLVISAETRDDVSGLGDEQKVIHALQGLAHTVAAAVAALGLARVVRGLSRATFDLRTETSATSKRPYPVPRRRNDLTVL